ncbi:Glutathione S-transferase domain protein [Sphingobium chlorophenolicum L-1]|uniref:Glutathione S-transferase domain protein n=1 Tax=Sphingobium chlorophenolicum L-1 TaxID=690566 RepID=F6F3N1_SPHCR|nr:glutathione S-transferase family protein [Sphingobium chlorophenolicum]AEG51043.1 Glutathione S-transferase domain protein [Sphingobium chlorophenolicum L-1]
MQLIFGSASPFVRKVRIALEILGLGERVTLVPVSTTPVAPAEELAAINPIAKIPVLVTASGSRIYGSAVIADYLQTLADAPVLIPASGDARWEVLHRQALIDGMTEAAVMSRYEQLRPAELRWAPWVDAQMEKVWRGLEAMEADSPALDGEPTIAEIALACLLGYLDFRFADRPWREDFPELARWFGVFDQRPEMVLTAPV